MILPLWSLVSSEKWVNNLMGGSEEVTEARCPHRDAEGVPVRARPQTPPLAHSPTRLRPGTEDPLESTHR